VNAWDAAQGGEPGPIRLGQAVVLLFIAGLLLNPPLASLAQVILVGIAVATRAGRARLAWALRQPLTLAVVAFLLVVAAGVLYTEGPREEAISTLWGWRKLLMLPLAMAFMASERGRRLLVGGFVSLCVAAAAVSFVAWALKAHVPTANAETDVVGMVVRNHSTQSAMFSLAIFSAAAVALLGTGLAARTRWLFAGASLFILGNLLLVTPGRSGYVALLVMLGVLALAWGRATGRDMRWTAAGAVLVVLLTLTALLAVPASRGRIVQALTEARDYQHQTQLTSMGIRVVFWRNSLPIIAERPWIGWGTGAFEEAYTRQVAGQTGVLATVTRDPHNQYLNILAQHGVLGFAVFLGFLAVAFRQRPPPGVHRVLAVGMLSAWCVTSLANSHFAMFAEASLLYVWLGALLAPPPPAA
jgi:O-antigen ligase